MNRLQNHDELKTCPFHGCHDNAVIKDNGFAFVVCLKSGARGAAYSLAALGEELAVQLAVADWNTRSKTEKSRFGVLGDER